MNVVVIFAFIVLTVAMAAKRLMDSRGVPVWIWLLLAASTAVPTWVGARVLQPGETVDTARLTKVHETVEIEIPPEHSLLIRGELTEAEKSEPTRSNYTILLTGDGWTQKATGEVRRKIEASDGPKIDAFGGASVQDRKSRRAGNFGEELEQRFDVAGTGTLKAELILLTGGALDAVLIDVIPSPPDRRLLWAIVAVTAVLGLVAEVRFGAVQLAGDVAFLSLFAVFLRDKVTAADALRESAGAALAAGLLGWGAVGGLAWLLLRAAANREVKGDGKGDGKKSASA